MTVRTKNRTLVAGIIVGIVALAATLLPMIAAPNMEQRRDIRIVVRDMAFYVDGGTEPNPAIVFRAGERVRIHLRNEDAGMQHDFTIAAWTVGTKKLEDRGEKDAVSFRVPKNRGSESYRCTPHATMMNGTIRVE